MSGNDINVTLAVVLTLAAAGGLGVWVSPKACRWFIKRLGARERALSAARAVYANEWKEAMREG